MPEAELLPEIIDAPNVDMLGQETAALLLMLFGEDEAALILSRLEPNEIQTLGESMFAVANVSETDVNQVLDRFIEVAAGRTTIGYRADAQIQNMMSKAIGPNRADNIMQRIARSEDVQHLEQLKWLSASEIAEMLLDEHPQIIALMLSQISAERAGQALQAFPQEVQSDIIFRIGSLKEVRSQAFIELENILAAYVTETSTNKILHISGTGQAAAIMNNVAKTDSKRIIKAMSKRDKKLTQTIEEQMFVFEDLINLDAKALGTLLRSVDNENLIPALKGANTALSKKIYGSMSSRAAQTIQDEIEELGPIAFDDVVLAQKSIVAQARVLADEGAIMLGDDGDGYV